MRLACSCWHIAAKTGVSCASFKHCCTPTTLCRVYDLSWAARSCQEGAITALQDACARTFAWLSPFTEALGALRHSFTFPLLDKRALLLQFQPCCSVGRGSVDMDAAAHKRRISLASSAESLHSWPEPCSAAHGAEIMPDSDLSRWAPWKARKLL